MRRTILAILIGTGIAAALAAYPVPLFTAEATSELADGAGRYSVAKAFDGDPHTSWVEGVDGDGVGESFTVVFDTPQRFEFIRALPGYHEERWWAANNRVREARITLLDDDGDTTEVIAAFQDALGVQTVKVPWGSYASVEFEIVSVYPGSRWADTCVAEFHIVSGGGFPTLIPLRDSPAHSQTPPIGARIYQDDPGANTFWIFHPDGTYETNVLRFPASELTDGEIVDYYEYGSWTFDDGLILMTTWYRSGRAGFGQPTSGMFVEYPEYEEFGRWGRTEHASFRWSDRRAEDSPFYGFAYDPGPFDGP